MSIKESLAFLLLLVPALPTVLLVVQPAVTVEVVFLFAVVAADHLLHTILLASLAPDIRMETLSLASDALLLVFVLLHQTLNMAVHQAVCLALNAALLAVVARIWYFGRLH